MRLIKYINQQIKTKSKQKCPTLYRSATSSSSSTDHIKTIEPCRYVKAWEEKAEKNRQQIRQIFSEERRKVKIYDEFVKANQMRIKRKNKFYLTRLVESAIAKSNFSLKIKDKKYKDQKILSNVSSKVLKERDKLKVQLKQSINSPLDKKIQLLQSFSTII